MDIYFISGMSANCKVFDKLTLPDGFTKHYIEWIVPDLHQSLSEYTHLMAESIDTSRPFILVGYSFGGIIVQEMNEFLNPVKNIILASIKNEDEIPPLFKFGKSINFAERFPWWSLANNQTVIEMLAQYVYHVVPEQVMEYVSFTNPVYVQWVVREILNWTPTVVCNNLYHIHGTRDQVFPYKYIKNAIPIKGGDHMMVFKRHTKISHALSKVLTMPDHE